MDMDKIQLAAAAQNTKLTENEKLRLEYMQKRLELEDAIAAKEANRALALANQLTTLEEKITSFKPASPFDAWETSIARMQNGLYNLGISEKTIGQGKTSPNLSVAPPLGDVSIVGGGIMPQTSTQANVSPQVNVTVNGPVGIDDLKKVIVDTVVDASSYGIPTNWFRTTGKAVMPI